MAIDLRGPDGEAEAVGRRNPDLPVGPAGRDKTLRLLRAAEQDSEEPAELLLEQGESVLQLETRRRIEHVVRGRAQVDISPSPAALLGDRLHDRHHVVVDLVLDRFRAVERSTRCTKRYLVGRFGRDHTRVGLGPRERDLRRDDRKEAAFLAPDSAHLRSTVPELDRVDRHTRDTFAASG